MEANQQTRSKYNVEEAEQRFPGALACFPDKDQNDYKWFWSRPTLFSTVIDGIMALPDSPTKTGYLFFKGKWRKL